MTLIHLGYEVGSGIPVAVPLRHIAVVGQTQESGKSTALEAMVQRACITAIAFVTKRGERAFAGGHRVLPYFRDRADWQFVTSILDATLQEKNKFLRPWIMKICRSTRTLADVQLAVRDALKSAKGLNEGVYTQLDAYLELIVPEIRRAHLAPTLDIARHGLSVMDVSSFDTPMQMLFVQSAIDWVNEHARETVVIIPEAWEFVPEGKGSPVKSSAVTLIRKGAALKNFLWVDSQDMAGVDKVILRGCPVWLIGVQREANEIKRNLANIPKGIKRPSAADVATLELGQFFVCYGTHTQKTYVQPAWMEDEPARTIAMTGIIVRADQVPIRKATTPQENTVNETEARQLRDENAQLRRRIEELEGHLNVPTTTGASSQKRESLSLAIESTNGTGNHDALFADFRARLLKEPAVLRLLTSQPEIRVEVTRETINVDARSVRGRIAQLIAADFFSKARTSSDVLEELQKRGSRPSNIELGNELKWLTEAGFFTRENKWYSLVPDMVVNVVER